MNTPLRHIILTPSRPVLVLPINAEHQAENNKYHLLTYLAMRRLRIELVTFRTLSRLSTCAPQKRFSGNKTKSEFWVGYSENFQNFWHHGTEIPKMHNATTRVRCKPNLKLVFLILLEFCSGNHFRRMDGRTKGHAEHYMAPTTL